MHKNNWKKLIRDYIEKQKKMIKKETKIGNQIKLNQTPKDKIKTKVIMKRIKITIKRMRTRLDKKNLTRLND